MTLELVRDDEAPAAGPVDRPRALSEALEANRAAIRALEDDWSPLVRALQTVNRMLERQGAKTIVERRQ